MDYSGLISRLFSASKTSGIKLGLANSLRLNAALGFPEKQFKSIHIAGTNGKGSTAAKIAKGLQCAGFSTGLYTSPHISCFRERIRFNDRMISEAEVLEMLPLVLDSAKKEEIPATFFELTTLLAFIFFADRKVDFAVLETGLGGRFDATNICRPELAVITSISLEHTDVLGTTIEEIAREKCGIIKPRTPVIIGPRVPYRVAKSIAAPLKAPCIQVEGNFPCFNEENNAIASMALTALGMPQQAIASGLQTKPPCRLEEIHMSNRPHQTVILDAAHNPDGLEHLFQAIRTRYPEDRLRIVFGLSKNKDIPSCLDVLKKYGSHFHIVESKNGRGESAKIISKMLIERGVEPERLSLTPTIGDNINLAADLAAELAEVLIICGTFFIMADARAALGISEPRDPYDLNETALVNPIAHKVEPR